MPTIVSDTTTVGVATVNPFRYRGYYYDNEIGMYYLQTRYYDPVVARFVNGDEPIYCLAHNNTVTNLCIYCNNDPIVYSDSYGTEPYYIYNQHNFWASNQTIGWNNTTMASMGCGYVAVYNVMHSFSSKINFADVVQQARTSGGLNFFYNMYGKNGLSIFSIISYFKCKFWRVNYRIGYWLYDWLFVSDFADAVVISYAHASGGGHYIAGIKDGYDFRFYNCILYDYFGNQVDLVNKPMSMYDFLKLLKNNNKTPTSIVGVRYKIGWW